MSGTKDVRANETGRAAAKRVEGTTVGVCAGSVVGVTFVTSIKAAPTAPSPLALAAAFAYPRF
jgi:hypothetical protein